MHALNLLYDPPDLNLNACHFTLLSVLLRSYNFLAAALSALFRFAQFRTGEPCTRTVGDALFGSFH